MKNKSTPLRSPRHSPRAKIVYTCTAAIIAAMYVVLTHISNALGLASGVIQCRISEALCVLPFFTAAAIPGLTIGCVIANITTMANIIDIIFGSLATLIGAIGARLLRKHKWLVPLPTILANTFILPFVLKYILHLEESVWFFFITIFIGELIAAGIVGIIFLFSFERLNKNRKIFK
jgi:uncharacterized membrane protein